jgi:hypothetical protein
MMGYELMQLLILSLHAALRLTMVMMSRSLTLSLLLLFA